MTETASGAPARVDPVDLWLRGAVEEATRRGLPELKPLLEGLASSTRELRAADWNDRVVSRLALNAGRA